MELEVLLLARWEPQIVGVPSEYPGTQLSPQLLNNDGIIIGLKMGDALFG